MRRSLLIAFASALVVAGLAAPRAKPAHALPPGYVVEPMHVGLDAPVAFRLSRDGRLFYLERSTGRIMVYPNASAPAPIVWATVAVEATGERGLLGLALHPQFPDSPFVYVYHTNPAPLVNRVVRFWDKGTYGTKPVIILDNLPATASIHHGGRLAFGPDRMLYVTYGDQTELHHASDPTLIRGKILRVTPLGLVPADNPFGATNRVWATGVRNPFGLCFDPLTGSGYFTENGPSCDDEVNQLIRGADYGWGVEDPCNGQLEGILAMSSFTPTIAPTGCVVYRSTTDPTFDGSLFFGSYNEDAVMRASLSPTTPAVVTTVDRAFVTVSEPVLDVTMGHDGLLWFSTTTAIYRVKPTGLTGVEDARLRAGFTARPNPFTGAVAFTLPEGVAVERLEILDISGRLVRHWQAPLRGPVAWDGADDAGAQAAPGVYFARLISSAGTANRRLVRIER